MPGPDPRPTNSEKLLEEVAYLRDLFERRIREDKQKQQMYDRLYDELDHARRGLRDEFLLPLIMEVFVVCDRLEREAENNDVLYSVVDELLEIFRRRGVEEIEWEGLFDPKVHEGVGNIAVEDPESDLRNISVVRHGYRLDQRILRPARVTVGKYTPTAQANSDSRFSSTVTELIDDLDEPYEA